MPSAIRILSFSISEHFEETHTLIHYCDARWLSRGLSGERFLLLHDAILFYLKEADDLPPVVRSILLRTNSPEWKFYLSSIVDFSLFLNEVSLRFQGNEKCIVDMFYELKATKTFIAAMIQELEDESFSRFRRCSEMIDSGFQPTSQQKQALLHSSKEVLQEFEDRFVDICSHEAVFAILANPFVGVATFHDETLRADLVALNSELIVMRGDPSMQPSRTQSKGKLEFYRDLPVYLPSIKRLARKYMSVFATSYRCEAAFSRMNLVKNDFRTRLTNLNLEAFLRLGK